MKKMFGLALPVLLLILLLTGCKPGGTGNAAFIALKAGDVMTENGVDYVSVRSVIDAAGYSTGGADGRNYVAVNENAAYWAFVKESYGNDLTGLLADDQAESYNFLFGKHGYRLYPGTVKAEIFEWGGSGLMAVANPPVVKEGVFYISCQDALWLLEVTVENDGQKVKLYKNDDLWDIYAEKASGSGYTLQQIDAFHKRMIAEKFEQSYLLDLGLNQMSGAYDDMSFAHEMEGISFGDTTNQGYEGGFMDYDGNILVPKGRGYVDRYAYTPYLRVTSVKYDVTFQDLYNRNGLCLYPQSFYNNIGNIFYTGTVIDGDYQYPLFDDGRVSLEKDGKWGFGDFEGNVLLPLEYDRLGYCPEDGGYSKVYVDGAADEKLLIVEKDGKFAAVNKDGEMVIPWQDTPFE